MDAPFTPGTYVCYGLHGKCQVSSVEIKTIGAEQQIFYRLEVVKSPLSRSHKQEPAIWLPVKTAEEKGLRLPMGPEQTQEALQILMSREYYFPLNEPWHIVHPKLETCIRHEGGIGLAKVFSYLHVLKKKQIVAQPEVNRMCEAVYKTLMREICESTGEALRIIEGKIEKGLRQKLLLDQ